MNLFKTVIRNPFLHTIICGSALALGFIGNITGILTSGIVVGLYIIAYISGGYEGLAHTLRDLKKFQINIDFLMIAAAIGAAIIGQWLEGAILLFLFSLSETLEDYALGKSRSAISSLMDLRPQQGLVLHPDGSEETVPVEDLKVGQIIIVKPGEHIPIDGKIIEGTSTIDQSAITGESVPVEKKVGDTVFAATLNEYGAIQIKVTKPANDTTLAKIIELVEKAQKNKAVTQRFLDRFEPIYAVSVVAIVALFILVPWLILKQNFDPVFYRAMTLLVVASPCALIISTPASIISAIANGARNGILFKGGAHVEQTVTIKTIAFDKTGTLTKGEPAVTDIVPIDSSWNNSENPDSITEKKLLEIAAGCEQYSEHHLAEAIVQKATESNLTPIKVQNLQSIPGQGVFADWNGKNVQVGNHKLFNDSLSKWAKEIHKKADELIAEGKTVVFVVLEKKPIGIIALADQIRPKARETLDELRKLGIAHIAMLTGDNKGVARNIAGQLGVDQIYAELLPDQKVEIINQLKKNGNVAMVGDGVNDAPALATSDLGIAMGAAGTDVALETADIVLMGDDLTKLPYLLKLVRKAKKVVWQNITFSLTVIVVLIAGVFWIDLPLTAGVVGHEGSTLIVVLNGLRLLRTRKFDD